MDDLDDVPLLHDIGGPDEAVRRPAGVLLRVGAVSVIIVMLGAIFIVHLPHGYDIGRGGLEYALTELLLALGLLLAGPGKYSLASVLPAPLRKL